MRLISCHIDNFGCLSGLDMSFDEGLNVIMRDNGWGKSTLAAFLRAMLYGFDTKRRDLSEKERKRYLPWQGGKFGGTLIFEKNGRRYRVERIFGERPQTDAVSFTDLDTGAPVRDVHNIGEWLFGLDADAFRRCAFIDQNMLGSGGTGQNIQARLSAVFGEGGDSAAYGAALARIDRRIREYNKTGGYIDEIQKKINSLLIKKKSVRRDIRRLGERRLELEKLNARLAQENETISQLRDRLESQEPGVSERDAVFRTYSQLKETSAELDRKIAELKRTSKGSIPDLSEIQAVNQSFGEIRRVSETLKKMKDQSFIRSAEIREQYNNLLAERSGLEKDIELILAEGAIPAEEELQIVRLGKTGIARVTEALEDLAANDERKKAEYLEKRENLLDRKKELDGQLDGLLEGGAIPDEGEIITVRQNAAEIERVSQALDALRKQAQENTERLRRMRDELIRQQTALENEYDSAIASLGDDPPSLADIRGTMSSVDRIAVLRDEAAKLNERAAGLESRISSISSRYHGQIPDAAEISDILQTYNSINVLESDISEQENDPVFTGAQERRAVLRDRFKGDIPEEEELRGIEERIGNAQSLENTAADIEAHAAADRSKRKAIDNEISALEAADKALVFDLKRPRATLGVLLIVAAVVALLPALIITPIAYAVAGGLLLLGIILLVHTSKKKRQYFEKREEFEKQKHINSDKMDKLRISRDLAGSGIREKQTDAMEKRAEADSIYRDVLAETEKWSEDITKENLAERFFLIKDDVKEMKTLQETLRSFEEKLERQRDRHDDLGGELNAKVTVLSSDTTDMPLRDRTDAALADIEIAGGLQADLNTCREQLSDRRQRLSQLEVPVKEVLERCGLTFDNAAAMLPEVEKKVLAATEIEQRLEEQRERLLDFDKANGAALSGAEELSADSAEGRLRAQLNELAADVRAVLDRYGYDGGNIEAWAELSERRAALYGELQQRQRELDSQLENLEANADVSDGEPLPDSAEGKLRAQLEALTAKVNAVLEKYEVMDMFAAEWLEFSEKRLEDKQSLEYKLDAVNKQIAGFESANSEALEGGDNSSDPAGADLEARLHALTDSVSLFLKKYGIPKGPELSQHIKAIEAKAAEYAELCQQREVQAAALREFEADNRAVLETRANDRGERDTLKLQLMEYENNRELLLRERAQAEGNISRGDEILSGYRGILRQIKSLGEEKQEAQRSLYVLKKSAEMLKSSKKALASRYVGQIEESFNSYLSGWVGGGLQGVVDQDLNVSVREDGKLRDVSDYSAGFADVIDICLRMALIDTLFTEERPFIIMDDPFVNLDERRTEHAMKLMKALSYDNQIIYFVCHPSRADAPGDTGAQIQHVRFVTGPSEQAPAKNAGFVLRSQTAVLPRRSSRRITSSVFPLDFAPEPELSDSEFEVFFVDADEKVICDRQRISYSGGELIPSRVRFSLNTGKASGNSYTLVIRNISSAENEAAKKIAYNVMI